jgi:polyhydroxybutyrate depolymerase
LETFVEHETQAGGFDRSYFVWLPAGYDPMRAYPLMIMGPGCGGNGENAIPVQNETGADAIVVGLNISAEAAGRDCFMTESAESPELAYFDAMWAEVSAAYCVDTARVFYGGFSSGSWLANLLGCARADVLRAQGNVAGGPSPIPECPGPVAAIMIHDENDGSNGIGGGEASRDRILEQNGCTGTNTMPWNVDYPECQLYIGCPAEYPVVWCPTSGQGHDPQNDFSAPAFWDFLMSLPPPNSTVGGG